MAKATILALCQRFQPPTDSDMSSTELTETAEHRHYAPAQHSRVLLTDATPVEHAVAILNNHRFKTSTVTYLPILRMMINIQRPMDGRRDLLDFQAGIIMGLNIPRMERGQVCGGKRWSSIVLRAGLRIERIVAVVLCWKRECITALPLRSPEEADTGERPNWELDCGEIAETVVAQERVCIMWKEERV